MAGVRPLGDGLPLVNVAEGGFHAISYTRGGGDASRAYFCWRILATKSSRLFLL